jgi:DNA-binding MarR family transcriptional regulator
VASIESSQQSGPCPYVVGDSGLRAWSQAESDAWIGLLEVSKRMTRELDGELDAAYGIGLSSLELLGRLSAADEQRLNLSALADAAHLSLSRVSRIVDALEERGLVQRHQCPSDARSVEALLMPSGLELTRRAQATHFAAVQERFFAQLAPEEIATLGAVFARLAPGAGEACSGSG